MWLLDLSRISHQTLQWEYYVRRSNGMLETNAPGQRFCRTQAAVYSDFSWEYGLKLLLKSLKKLGSSYRPC